MLPRNLSCRGGRLNQAAFSVDYKRKIINRSPLFFFNAEICIV